MSAIIDLMSLQRGFTPLHLVLLVSIIGILLVLNLLVNSSQNDQQVKGTLIAKGDDDNKSSSSGSSGSDSSGSSINTPKPVSTPNLESEEDKKEMEPTPQGGVRIKTQEKNDQQRTEIRLSETERIKTKVEEGKTKIEVTQGGIRVKFVIKDGRVKIKAETEGEGGVDDQTLFKIEQRLDKAGIKVATAGGKLVIARNNVGTISDFPLQIDLATNQLIASTSAGARVLTVLPDQAVQNMLAANVISRLGPPAIREVVPTGQVASVSDIIALGERNGVPIYQINGLRDFRLLGFIPVSLPVAGEVSAQTGEVFNQPQSLLLRIVDLLSP